METGPTHSAARFGDRRVLVTGGSKGIGAATALRLAQEGATVAITWFRDQRAVASMTDRFHAVGVDLHAVRVDLSKPEAARRAVLETENLVGPVELLVSNAASGVYRPLRALTFRHWRWTVDTNAAAFLWLLQAARSVRAAVALTSLAAWRVQPSYGVIAASKAAMESLVRYAAVELAPATRVNAVSAGLVDTQSVRRLLPDIDDALQAVRTATPLGRLVTPDDVASLVTFLLSDDAAMITGQTFLIDGGYSLRA